MKKQTAIVLGILGIVFFINIISAQVIEIEQPSFNISMHAGETFFQNITINTNGNYLVYLFYNVTNNNSNLEGFSVNFIPESPTFVDGTETVLVEISTSPSFKSDNFILNIFAETAKVTDLFFEDYTGNNGIIDTGFGLILEMNSTGTGTVTVQKYASNPVSGLGIPALGKFFEIDADQAILDNMGMSIIKVFYTDAEVSAAGIDESTLRLYFFNETSSTWQAFDAPNGGVDTINNFVFAITDHFSTWGVFGSFIDTTTSTESTGGGGGYCTTQWTCTEWSACVDGVQTRTCSYPVNFCVPKAEKPVESQTCTATETAPESPAPTPGFFATITGAVIGALGTGGAIFVLVFIVIVVVLAILAARQSRPETKKAGRKEKEEE